MFSWKKAGGPAGLLCALLICTACGDTYRPTASVIVTPGGDPQPARWIYAMYTNPTGTNGSPGPGALQQIDVSGDSVAVNIPVGVNPSFSNFLGTISSEIVTVNQGVAADHTESAVTAQPLCNPSFSVCNPQPPSTITLPTGTVPTAVGSRQSSTVYVLDSVSPTCPSGAVNAVTTSLVVTNTACVGANPVSIAQVPNGGRAFIVNQGDNTVTVMDPVTQAIIATVPVGSNPVKAVTDLTGKYVFVVNKGSNDLTVITTADNTTTTIPVGSAPNFAIFNSRVNRLYVTNSGSNSVSVLDLSGATPVLLKTVAVGPKPTSVVALVDGSRYYVANSGDSSVSVLDGNSNTVLSTVTLLGSAITSPNPLWIESDPQGTKVYVTTPAPPAGTHAANNPNDAPGITILRTDLNTVSNFLQAPQADPNCQVNPAANPPATCAYQVPLQILTFPR